MSKELYFNCCLSHFIVSDVSGFLIRRQNRPDILSAGEEVSFIFIYKFIQYSTIKLPDLYFTDIRSLFHPTNQTTFSTQRQACLLTSITSPFVVRFSCGFVRLIRLFPEINYLFHSFCCNSLLTGSKWTVSVGLR